MISKILIPEKRVAVLIGRNGRVKKDVEKATNVKIKIDGEITISGDAVDLMTAENVIKAIGRGFSPENAAKLLDENNTLCIIPLPDNRKELIRVRARLIGTRGKARRNIETLTGTSISVYGKTVSAIGSYENIEKAKEAIEKLIAGSPHRNVYKSLEQS